MSLRTPATELLATPVGVRLECLATGSGAPVTVFAHGLATGIAQTRPLGTAVPGTRVFFHFRGHGRSQAPAGPWGYRDLAADLDTVAYRYAATRALGVSLGAAALCRLLADAPLRFDRVVFYLPAALDQPHPPAARQRYAQLRAVLDRWPVPPPGTPGTAGTAGVGNGFDGSRALAEITEVLARDAPGTAGLRERAEALLRHGLGTGLAGVLDDVPVPELAALAAVTVPALVIGAQGDPVHPVSVATRLAAALPRADLHVYDQPGPLFTARTDLRERISGFFAG